MCSGFVLLLYILIDYFSVRGQPKSVQRHGALLQLVRAAITALKNEQISQMEHLQAVEKVSILAKFHYSLRLGLDYVVRQMITFALPCETDWGDSLFFLCLFEQISFGTIALSAS